MNPISGVSTLNANSARLVTQRREAGRQGEKAAVVSGVRSTSRLHTVTRMAVFSTATVQMTGAPIAPLTRVCYPTVLSERDPPSGYDLEHLLSFTAVEAPTEAEAFWLFGPTTEPVDTRRLFGGFGGVTDEEAGGSAFIVEGGPVQERGLRQRITGRLAAMIRVLRRWWPWSTIWGSHSAACFMPE